MDYVPLCENKNDRNAIKALFTLQVGYLRRSIYAYTLKSLHLFIQKNMIFVQ